MDTTLFNFCYDTTRLFGDITGNFTTLVDMGTTYMFRGLMIYSSFDQPVIIKFTNSELLIPAVESRAWEMSFDNFRHNNLLEIKHAGDAPTEGFLKVVSWRAE